MERYKNGAHSFFSLRVNDPFERHWPRASSVRPCRTTFSISLSKTLAPLRLLATTRVGQRACGLIVADTK